MPPSANAPPADPIASCHSASLAGQLFRTWRTAYRWERAVEAALSNWKLGYARFMLLDLVEQLQTDEGELTQAQLCQLIQLTESGVHRAVMALEERNLLKRDIDESYVAWNVFVTEEGRNLLAVTRPIVESLARQFVRTTRYTGFP